MSSHNFQLPSTKAIEHSFKLAVVEDMPIMMDYWVPSLEGKIIIGIRDNKDEHAEEKTEKLLIKNSEEYTSPIQKIFKTENEYIILTENSLYLVSSKCQTRRIS